MEALTGVVLSTALGVLEVSISSLCGSTLGISSTEPLDDDESESSNFLEYSTSVRWFRGFPAFECLVLGRFTEMAS